uniref:hypothetical protein n=1 Tax=Levilactobacillus brevis TaxID=1580 RepID=UPI001CDBC3A6|nr:hypothetical protein [Levilactobacillus brevis]
MSNNTPKPHKINDKGQITRKNKKLVDHTSIKIRRNRRKNDGFNPQKADQQKSPNCFLRPWLSAILTS